ncbi:hypothetical protein FRX31_025737 [Thalictrum thalictroides]|uniref:Endonuclease/exonuclease/phosphatase domain-containing protein n=1 Tax=Thalictrum thalictroides TaxID=46969 RepID=A0A7J6VK26_THATH|nr:hypothetical protein FRX31_025737 [Thalictrum thalictroides]
MARILTWNARGLCNLDAQGSVNMLRKKSKADVIMIQETKVRDKEVIEKTNMWPNDWKWAFCTIKGVLGRNGFSMEPKCC